MGIAIASGKTKWDWKKITSAAAEVVIQAAALGKDGFSGAISALFRVLESLRGEDDLELRATRLVIETLTYAASATIAASRLKRRPLKAEAEMILEGIVARAIGRAEQNSVKFEPEHLKTPTSFVLFKDAASRIFDDLRFCEPIEEEASIAARFRRFVAEGLNRIRVRDPDYFLVVIQALSNSDAIPDTRARAWDRYRASLVHRFESEPLFGEDAMRGATLGQVYQPLRCSWDFDKGDADIEIAASQHSFGRARQEPKVHRYIRMLDELAREWLASDDKMDRIRLISGGPGSGKSTFAKCLAATLAPDPKWRVIFVPLQRLKGAGPLETRIDDYFRLQVDEPFDAETTPLAGIGRDDHRDWLIIFDGLDELAKEGSSSETAAQDFASSLADWRGRLGTTAVRFIVLGRAPSMQEARRRLALDGKGTIYVADMVPQKSEQTASGVKIILDDPLSLAPVDQRKEFWTRWAAAKGLQNEPPEAMTNEALLDLTKEPLLAYLLIFSGFASERWPEAADNKNRIYQAIFDQIWERERGKATRSHLNDLGKEGFETLMQTLGLAAWRGGGRTGDEATFTAVRDTFMRPDLLTRAKACGAADLGNVALLFYTRKDEEGGRGYEFLHKSFGEYLTARGLLNAFQRWGSQVIDPVLDFGTIEFLRRWLKLSGSTPITREIIIFLGNEVRLQAQLHDSEKPWIVAREWVEIGQRVVDLAVRDGIPAHDVATTWREADGQEKNSERCLFAILSACAAVAYPMELRTLPRAQGGWDAGPIRVPTLEQDVLSLSQLIDRLRTSSRSEFFIAERGRIMMWAGVGGSLPSFSRLSLRGVHLFGHNLTSVDFSGADLEGANLVGTTWFRSELGGANLRDANLNHATFYNTDLAAADIHGANIDGAIVDGASLKNKKGKKTIGRLRKRKQA